MPTIRQSKHSFVPATITLHYPRRSNTSSILVMKTKAADSDTTNATSASIIQLGFSEPIQDKQHLTRVAHRSCNYDDWDGGQIGGVCVWLDPEHVPKPIHCGHCQTQLIFICQLYAPLDEVPEAFHRTLYVFACPSCQDPSNSVCILRCQLGRYNSYYPAESEGNDSDWKQHLPTTWNTYTCAVCGMAATTKCPLQSQFFCCKEHQKEYKRHVFDKANDVADATLITQLPSVFALSELVVEEEPPFHDDDAELDQRASIFPARNCDDDSDASSDSDQDLEQDDLNEMVVGKRDKSKHDVSQDLFAMEFYSRLKSRPGVQTQCLRYSRWPDSTDDDGVLWIQRRHQLESDPPPCEHCGSPRKFEFQILPQMLHYLLAGHMTTAEKPPEAVTQALEQAESWVQQAPPEHVPPALMDAKQAAIERIQKNLLEAKVLDWGVIVVYTCTASCKPLLDPDFGSYCREFAWRQPSLDNALL
ncbi:programmed cell death protein 2 [Mayamaea pseudoterrestris]|nr:programmed cell death protein 2 [Mayamaea pseudoterrestris]